MRRRGVLTIACVLATAVAAFASAADEIVVTRETAALPPGCGPREVATLLADFVEAARVGERARLDRLLARDFERFFVPEPEFRSEDRAEVLDYLAAGRESTQLLSVSVTPAAGDDVGIGFTVSRANVRRPGKAKIDCDARTVRAWVVYPSEAPGTECGQPRPPAILACAAGPNARELAPDFRILPSKTRLQPGCTPGEVRERVRAMLRAFNRGQGRAFAASFTSGRTTFTPYGRPVGAVRDFVVARYRAGDGWTATQLLPPRQSRGEAIYGLGLRVTQEGRLLGETGAKLVLVCRTNRVRTWVGPAVVPRQ